SMPKLKQYSNLFVDLSTSDTKGRWLDWKSAAATANGKLIGAGTDIGPEAICYRSDPFVKAGLASDPAGVATLLTGDWNNYYSVGQRFTAAHTGTAWFDSAGATFQGLANQYPNFFEQNDGTVIATTNPDVKAAFTTTGNYPSQVAAYTDPALTGAMNPYFNNAPIGKIFAERAKAVKVTPYKGVKYAAIMQAVQDGLTRVESKKQTIDASWAQVV